MAVVSAVVSYRSKNFSHILPPEKDYAFGIKLPKDKIFDIGIDQSSSCTGIAISSTDDDLNILIDVRNDSFDKNTFYRELKGILYRLIADRKVRDITCEDPPPVKGKKYASTVLLELRGRLEAWIEEIDELRNGNFDSIFPQTWKSLVVDKSKGKNRSNIKECIADDICDIYPEFRKYKNVYATKDYDGFDAFGILLGHKRYAYTEDGIPLICGKVESRHTSFVGYRYVDVDEIKAGKVNDFLGKALTIFKPAYRMYNGRYNKYQNIRMATSNRDCTYTIMPDKEFNVLRWQYDLEPKEGNVLMAYMFNYSHYPQATKTALKSIFPMHEEVKND